MIGYYANRDRDRRRGPVAADRRQRAVRGRGRPASRSRVLLLAVKALFFFADNGYRDRRRRSLTCQTGADCVYQRYLAAGQGDSLAAAGVTDAASFTRSTGASS